MFLSLAHGDEEIDRTVEAVADVLRDDLWATIAAEAAAREPALARRAPPSGEREREAVFSPLADEQFALGLETIYEGYLVHYGRPRLFGPTDEDTALLLGDYLYAHGLVRIADAAASTRCASGRADLALRASAGRGRAGDGEAWARRPRAGSTARATATTRAREQALAAHARRVG